MTVSLHIFILAALITTAIAAGGAPENFPESVNTLQDQTESISKVNIHQKPMAIPEEAIGETVAELLEKMNLMQRTVDDLRASNYELRASNYELRASVDQLTDSNGQLEASNTDMTKRLIVLERSNADSTICTGVRECLYVEAEEREALSKDLYDAAVEGNAREIRRLAAMGAHLEYRDHFNMTALYQAALNGHVEAVRALIELEAHLEARNVHANTPLHAAVGSKREECVELLLSAGASLIAGDVLGSNALHYAAVHNYQSVVKLLLDAGADRSAKNNHGTTPRDLTNDADTIDILENYFPIG